MYPPNIYIDTPSIVKAILLPKSSKKIIFKNKNKEAIKGVIITVILSCAFPDAKISPRK